MERTASPLGSGRHPLRVLVVDDNQDAADTTAILVRLWGHETRVAYDGPSAVRIAQEFAPDCVLLDITMPGMSGIDVARQLRAASRDRLKLVAVTAYSSEEHRREEGEAGFDFHLTKPADPDQLRGLLDMLDKVMEVAERAQHLAEQNVELAEETRQLLRDVKDDIKEIKEDIKGVKEEIREVKDRCESEGQRR